MWPVYLQDPELAQFLQGREGDQAVQSVPIHQGMLDSTINNLLSESGFRASADRAYCFKFHRDMKAMTNTHEWCRDGIQSFKDRLVDMPTSSFRYLTARISANKMALLDLQADEISETERLEMASQGIHTLLLMPIADIKAASSEATILGFVGFDSCSPLSWSQQEIAELSNLAEQIGNRKAQKPPSLCFSGSVTAVLGPLGAVFVAVSLSLILV